MILSIAIVLDPRYKIKFVIFFFSKIDPLIANARVEKALDHLELLFKEYLIPSTFISLSMERTTSNKIGDVPEDFDVFKNQSEFGRKNTQLDLYMDEPKQIQIWMYLYIGNKIVQDETPKILVLENFLTFELTGQTILPMSCKVSIRFIRP